MGKTIPVDLGPVDELPLEMGLCFVIKGAEIAVFRSRDGRIFAVQNRCPHRQGTLSDGIMGAGIVICPSHGHKFDLVTGQGSEAGECVKIFSVRDVNGRAILDYPTGV